MEEYKFTQTEEMKEKCRCLLEQEDLEPKNRKQRREYFKKNKKTWEEIHGRKFI